MIPLTEIFTMIDDYCKIFDENMEGLMLPNPQRKRKRPCRISLSEIMTIIIMFQLSHYRTFKDFYLDCLLVQYRKEFPNYVSYNRFVELMPLAFMPMAWMMTSLSGTETGKYFIDSTKLPVCHNLRINRHKVFKDCAKRGKTSTGWFFGFKLHLVFNEYGEIMRFALTQGNVDDRNPVESMMKRLKGWLIGDRGYISQKLKETLAQQGVELITKVKKNMKEHILEPAKSFLLGKRAIVETIIDQLKNILHIDHTRHRSIMNFQVHVLAALLAYTFLPKKPSVKFNQLNNLCPDLTSN
jgi:Transposase DDE domain